VSEPRANLSLYRNCSFKVVKK